MNATSDVVAKTLVIYADDPNFKQNIGIATAWVDAVHNRYHLIPDWYKIIQVQKFNFKL
jgi:hypothetical protein